VDWPASAFPQADSPIQIGIVGKDPFGADLEKTLKNKTVKNRTFTVVHLPEPGDIRSCHMLSSRRSEKGRLPEILEQAGRWPVLTVGRGPGLRALRRRDHHPDRAGEAEAGGQPRGGGEGPA